MNLNEIPLTINKNGTEFIVSQVRLCRNCGIPIDLHCNYQYYFDIKNRIALLQHQMCPRDFGNNTRKVISPEDKDSFLYGLK